MQKWEYLHVYVGISFNVISVNGEEYFELDEDNRSKPVSIHEYIGEAGIKGWELVALAFNVGIGGGYTYYFKRPLAGQAG
jgi:hypothetical protein